MHATRPFRQRTPLTYWLVFVAGLVFFLPGAAASGSHAIVDEVGDERKQSTGLSEKLHWTRLSPQEGAEVLNMLIARQKGNYERIRTWTGVYRFREKEHSDGKRASDLLRKLEFVEGTVRPPLCITTTGVFRFVVDVESNSLYTSCEPDGPRVVIEKATGKTVGHLGSTGGSEKTILTPEHYLHFSTNTNLGQLKGLARVRLNPNNKRVAYKDAPGKGRKLQWSTIMDPRLLFGTNRRPFFDTFESYPQFVSESLESTTRTEYPCHQVYVRKGGDNDGAKYHVAKRYLFSGTPGDSHEEDVILDAKVGFNAVEASQGTGSNRRQKTTWEYRNIDGIRVPCSIRFEILAVDESPFDFERVLTLEECNLNRAVNPASFTYKQFGMKNGERLFDRIENVLYVYQNGEFVLIDRL